MTVQKSLLTIFTNLAEEVQMIDILKVIPPYFFERPLVFFLKKRFESIRQIKEQPLELQQNTFDYLIHMGGKTDYGEKYTFHKIRNYRDFQNTVPLVSYEEFFPWIQRLFKGEQNVLWPTKVSWFAKSSGTTNDRSKFIPITRESLQYAHYAGGKDMIAVFYQNYHEVKTLMGKALSIGGSCTIGDIAPNRPRNHGDISAVITRHLPAWAQFVRTPPVNIALLDDWEEKLTKMVEITASQNITSLLGVPTWTLVLLERMLAYNKKEDIREIWSNLNLFVHGAVSFSPYKNVFRKLMPPDMKYIEVYTASEGSFALQDLPQHKGGDVRADGMLLMLNYGIFYEFIPVKESQNKHPTVLTLADVAKEEDYEMVISTNGGLWRYRIGDTVRFVSLFPFRIKIVGRTKLYINAFGEEVIEDNTNYAIEKACQLTNATLVNYTIGPLYLDTGKKGAHEWIVAFYKEPNDWDLFCQTIDAVLKEINSDYDAKRSFDIALRKPVFHKVHKDTFYLWMKKKNKLGGQNKVPRLSNDRKYIEEILHMLDNEPIGA